MNSLKDVVAYLVQNYPHSDELSDARLTKMVYLSDWKYSIDKNVQITQIEWKYNHYGPYVRDIYHLVTSDSNFQVKPSINAYGHPKTVIMMKHSSYQPKLSTDVRDTLDFVINQTMPLSWHSFILLVYSTYPVLASEKMSKLDLPKLAKEYTSIKASKSA